MEFRTFVETSMPVVDHFAEEDRVVKVSAIGTENEVYERVVAGLADKGIHPTRR